MSGWTELSRAGAHMILIFCPFSPVRVFWGIMSHLQEKLCIGLLALFLPMCAAAQLSRGSALGERETGLAVYYSDRFHGKPTASGELYDKTALTAAHRRLPFGAIVQVTNQRNRRSVRVKINDRGPFDDKKRVIDLSFAAAQRLDMIRAGVVPVQIELISLPQPKS